MEKISSRLVAKGYKISWETEREQVISTSMHLPLNCSACVISKFQVLFRYKDEWQHFSFQKQSSQNTLTPFFLPCGKETWPTILVLKDNILPQFISCLGPTRTSGHHTSIFLSSPIFFLFYKIKQGTGKMSHGARRKGRNHNIILNNRCSDSRRVEKSTILQE